jgi:hypothetical protein
MIKDLDANAKTLKIFNNLNTSGLLTVEAFGSFDANPALFTNLETIVKDGKIAELQ